MIVEQEGGWVPEGGEARAGRTRATSRVQGSVWVWGGGRGEGGSGELYDRGRGTWMVTGSMGNARAVHTATLLANGKVLVAGGFNPSDLTSAELYDPGTGTWMVTGSMGNARAQHT